MNSKLYLALVMALCLIMCANLAKGDDDDDKPKVDEKAPEDYVINIWRCDQAPNCLVCCDHYRYDHALSGVVNGVCTCKKITSTKLQESDTLYLAGKKAAEPTYKAHKHGAGIQGIFRLKW